MFKIIKEIYYGIRLGCWMKNYPVDKTLCDIIICCLNSGIKEVGTTEYHLEILFHNGVRADFWNASKYYAWLKHGTFKRGDAILYQYSERMLSNELMFKLEKAIAEHLLKSFQAQFSLSD